MAPSPYAVELCALLVEETHGQLLSRIFTILLKHGRLEVAGVIRHTRLTPRQVKRGLAVLIQQHLVFHHSPKRDSATAYEANWKSAYSLLRYGKIIQYTHERFGQLAETIISRLLQLGHCRVRDIVKQVEKSLKNASADKSLPNGLNDHMHLTNGDNVKSTSEAHGVRETLQILAQHGFIRRMRPAHFRSPADNRAEAENWVKIHKTFTKTKGPQFRLEVAQAVEVTLNEWYDGRIQDGQIFNGSPVGSKRKRAEPDAGRGRKRARLQNGAREIQDEDESDLELVSLSDDLLICVNHEKYLVAFRNATLILQAEQSIGKTTSQVYEALLARVEQRLQCCKPNHDIFPNRNEADPSIPTYHIRHELDASLDAKVLTSAIGKADPSKIQLDEISKNKRKGRVNFDYDKDEAEVVGFASSDESIDTEPEDVAEIPRALKYYNKQVAITNPVIPHLLLLAEDPTFPFCESLDLQNWLVPSQPLSQSLLCKILLSIITTRFGNTSARLARILLTSSPNIPTLKLSDAQLMAKSLLPPKAVRSALARMQAAQFLAIQEIPRDNQRQPSRTTYLWFFDVERVRTLVEGECYKTMSRLIQRINVEKGKNKALLDKVDRSDMKGNEDKFLTAGESEALRKWRAMESRIWGQVSRMDEMVMVLRDF